MYLLTFPNPLANNLPCACFAPTLPPSPQLGVVCLSAQSSAMVMDALRKNKREKHLSDMDALNSDPTPDEDMMMTEDSSSATNKRPVLHPDSHNGRKLARQTAARQGWGSRPRSDRPDLNPPPALASGGPMAAQRKSLPVFSFREKLLATIHNNAVTVIEGETGSGKTTQVPQYVLEDAAERGETGNIIVAQPRRISAMSVAERVAAERGEVIGGTIGYTIRLESRASRNTRMLFCTTGILLKRLEDDKDLENVTHVFVDEVHERSIESDFLLMVLRDCMNHRTKPLKIILMSATLDATLFHSYFNGAPSVKFPGRTFPVTELYLEHAIEATGHVVNSSDDWVRKGKKPDNNASPHGAPRPTTPDDEELSVVQLSQRYPQFSSRVHTSLQMLDHNAIDYRLVCDTIRWMCSFRGPEGAKQWLERFNSKARMPPPPPESEVRLDEERRTDGWSEVTTRTMHCISSREENCACRVASRLIPLTTITIKTSSTRHFARRRSPLTARPTPSSSSFLASKRLRRSRSSSSIRSAPRRSATGCFPYIRLCPQRTRGRYSPALHQASGKSFSRQISPRLPSPSTTSLSLLTPEG